MKNLNNLLQTKKICLFFLQKTLVTQANYSASKSLRNQKIKYSTERLIVGKLLLLVSCPVNVLLKEQKYYHANHHHPTLDSTSSFLKANYPQAKTKRNN